MNDKQNILQNQTEEKPKVTKPSLEIPKEIKQDGWKMPEPVFRCSSGKTLQGFDKEKLNARLRESEDGQTSSENQSSNADDLGVTTMAFINLSDLQREEFEKTGSEFEKTSSAPDIQPQPNISEEFSVPQAVQAEIKVEETPKKSGLKWLLLLGGLFLFFALVLAGVFAVYYLYFMNR